MGRKALNETVNLKPVVSQKTNEKIEDFRADYRKTNGTSINKDQASALLIDLGLEKHSEQVEA